MTLSSNSTVYDPQNIKKKYLESKKKKKKLQKIIILNI